MAKEKKVKPAKVETEAQRAKRKEREAKELAKLQREKTKPRWSGYIAYFVMIISVIYIADEVASQLGSQMQEVLALRIFAPVFGAQMAATYMGYFGLATSMFAGLSFLYKPLSDRYGRKIFLVINTLGMGMGMLLIGLCNNGIPLYLIGASFIAFFTPHDIHAVYIQECAPKNHRAKMYSVIKTIATLGALIIPMLSDLFITRTGNSDNWNWVYLVPGIVTFVIAVIGLFCVRESDAFIEMRIAQLNMTDEEREQSRRDKEDKEARGGFVKGLKYAFRHKQLKWLFIAGGLIMFGMLITGDYSTIITYGYAREAVAELRELNLSAEMFDAELVKILEEANAAFTTKALFVLPIASAIVQGIAGFISDWFGRKKTCLIMYTSSVVCYVLYFVGCNNYWDPQIVGLLTGAAIGCFWAGGDASGLMVAESTPTNMRVSVCASHPIVGGMIYSVAMYGSMILKGIYGDAYFGYINVALAVPGMVIGIILLMLKTKDTVGIDMDTVSSSTFE